MGQAVYQNFAPVSFVVWFCWYTRGTVDITSLRRPWPQMAGC